MSVLVRSLHLRQSTSVCSEALGDSDCGDKADGVFLKIKYKILKIKHLIFDGYLGGFPFNDQLSIINDRSITGLLFTWKHVYFRSIVHAHHEHRQSFGFRFRVQNYNAFWSDAPYSDKTKSLVDVSFTFDQPASHLGCREAMLMWRGW